MGRFHKEPRQRVLFGPDRRDRSGNTPQWQSLPPQTRQKAIRLMARLFIEHCRTPGTEGKRRPPVLDQMRRAVMSEKIERHHLERKAIVYVRQSSVHQVMHNRESRALQYAMRERVGQLGWSRIEVIDDDQGRSASGSAEREGFNRMVAEVCLGKVGAVAAREVSRFARSN